MDSQKNVVLSSSGNSTTSVAEMNTTENSPDKNIEISILTKSKRHENLRPILQNKFRGCLIGSLIGDCIGTLFECDYSVSCSILGDLYLSFTSLSEDEKLLDSHGYGFLQDMSKAREIVESIKRRKTTQDESPRKSFDTLLTSDKNAKHAQQSHQFRQSCYESDGRRGSFSRPIERYSDDTVMVKSVIASLMKSNGLDLKDVAKKLSEDYFLNTNRKFGHFIANIFAQLRDSGYVDPYGPAKKCQANRGSHGNESATRVAPISLFLWHSDSSAVIDYAAKMSKLTHYHKIGVNGAVLQALAVHTALTLNVPKTESVEPSVSIKVPSRNESNDAPAMSTSFNSSEEKLVLEGVEKQQNILKKHAEARLNVKEFLEYLLSKMHPIEHRSGSFFEVFGSIKNLIQSTQMQLHHLHSHSRRDSLRSSENKDTTYSDKLHVIQEFLDRIEPPGRSEIVEQLGNGVMAVNSVPTAIYCFLLAAQYDTLAELPVRIQNPVLRTIFFAISLGGDTNTIASMAGAIAGAYWGYASIPSEIIRVCEGSRAMLKLADEFLDQCLL